MLSTLKSVVGDNVMERSMLANGLTEAGIQSNAYSRQQLVGFLNFVYVACRAQDRPRVTLLKTQLGNIPNK